MEDPAKARGFQRVRLLINTAKPLVNGCWLSRENNRDTWVEFRYERLQDFCYRCGHLNHVNNECTFEASKGEETGFGDKPQAFDLTGSQNDGNKALRVEQRDEIATLPRERKKWHRKSRAKGTTGHLNWIVPQSIRQSLWGSRTSCYPFFQNITMQQSGADLHSVIIQEINEDAHTLPSVDVVGTTIAQGDSSPLSFPTFYIMEGTKQKRGKEPQTIEISQSPQKKVRGS
ncbi:hypothetical protein ACFX12_013443 [Malus domestica]